MEISLRLFMILEFSIVKPLNIISKQLPFYWINPLRRQLAKVRSDLHGEFKSRETVNSAFSSSRKEHPLTFFQAPLEVIHPYHL